MSMTPEELSRLRELCEKASGGPWEALAAAPGLSKFVIAIPQLLDEVERLQGAFGRMQELVLFEFGMSLCNHPEPGSLREELDAQMRISARWISKAAEAENALNEANKLLDQTIEVLEEKFGGRECMSWTEIKPLLDNLKARKP